MNDIGIFSLYFNPTELTLNTPSKINHEGSYNLYFYFI